MDENVSAAGVRLNEPEALRCIKPFHCAGRHDALMGDGNDDDSQCGTTAGARTKTAGEGAPVAAGSADGHDLGSGVGSRG
jgi:hypothetical protein